MNHFVQLYQDAGSLSDSVAAYVNEGLRGGEAAIIIARPEHRAAFLERIDGPREALRVLDAEHTLAALMSNGMPQWAPFRDLAGGLIAELRLQYAGVRAYGEMVDLLWQDGQRAAAVRLEEYWNELGKLQTFSLYCAYRMDPRDGALYGGPLESVCNVHSQLVPAPDQQRFDEAVHEASRKVLDEPLASLLLSLAASHRVPAGQAGLFWLKQNMPRTAEKVLGELSAAAGASPAA